jgi:hypothetical protein
MKKVLRILWLAFLSVFPVSSLLNNVEMENLGESEKKRPL